jgi:hypothetical protein
VTEPRRPVRSRFHGRVEGSQRRCNRPGCTAAGEFRAPDPQGRRPGFDGPGNWQWLCLDHVREFNAGYNYFQGMTREEIEEAQMPMSGWDQESRAFRPTAGVDTPPRWADFHDPLDAISTRFRARVDAAMPRERADGIALCRCWALGWMPIARRCAPAIQNWSAPITRIAMGATAALKRNCKAWWRRISICAGPQPLPDRSLRGH